jgi:hypothetical protein
MRVDRGLLNWGVFLVALGGVPLLVQLGRLDAAVTGDLWRFWPLILVGIGLGLVLRLTLLAWLGGALVAATLGILLGSLLAGGVGGFSAGCVGGGERESSSRSGLASGATLDLELELTCGEVVLSRAPAARWVVEAVHGPERPPVIEASTNGLSVRPAPGGDGVFPFLDQARNEWTIAVPSLSDLSVAATLNAASGELALGPGALGAVGATLNAADVRVDMSSSTSTETISLAMTFNASSGTVLLPVAASLEGELTLNASSVTLCASPDAGLRVQSDGTLSSDDFDGAGLERVGNAWQTPSFSDALPGIDLRISSTVSSVSLDRSGTCD